MSLALLPSLRTVLESLGRDEALYTNSWFSLVPVSITFYLDERGAYKPVKVETNSVRLEGVKYEKEVREGEIHAVLLRFREREPGERDYKMAFLLSSFIFLKTDRVNEFLDDVLYSFEINGDSFGESLRRSLMSTVREVKFYSPYLGLRRVGYSNSAFSSAITLCTDSVIGSIRGLNGGLDYRELLKGFEGVREEVEKEIINRVKYMATLSRSYDSGDTTFAVRFYDKKLYGREGKILADVWYEDERTLGLDYSFVEERSYRGSMFRGFRRYLKDVLSSRRYEYSEIVDMMPNYEFFLTLSATKHEYQDQQEQDIVLVPFDHSRSSENLKVDFLVCLKRKIEDIKLSFSRIELSEDFEKSYNSLDYDDIVDGIDLYYIYPSFQCELRVSKYHDLFPDPVYSSDSDHGERWKKSISTSVTGTLTVEVHVPPDWSEEEFFSDMPRARFYYAEYVKGLNRVYNAQFTLKDDLSVSDFGGLNIVKFFENPGVLREFGVSFNDAISGKYLDYIYGKERIDMRKARGLLVSGVDETLDILGKRVVGLSGREGSFVNMTISLAKEVRRILERLNNNTDQSIHAFRNTLKQSSARNDINYFVVFRGPWLLGEGAVPESKTAISSILEPVATDEDMRGLSEADRKIRDIIGYGSELCLSLGSDRVKVYPLGWIGDSVDDIRLSYVSSVLSNKIKSELLSDRRLVDFVLDPLYQSSLYISSISLSSVSLLEKEFPAFLYPPGVVGLTKDLAETIFRTFLGGVDDYAYHARLDELPSLRVRSSRGDPVLNLRKALEKFLGLVVKIDLGQPVHAEVLTSRDKPGVEVRSWFVRDKIERIIRVYLAFSSRDGKVVLLRTFLN